MQTPGEEGHGSLRLREGQHPPFPAQAMAPPHQGCPPLPSEGSFAPTAAGFGPDGPLLSTQAPRDQTPHGATAHIPATGDVGTRTHGFTGPRGTSIGGSSGQLPPKLQGLSTHIQPVENMPFSLKKLPEV